MPKKTTPKAAPKKPTKTSFVLSLPRTTPAKEVVAKAKTAGISLSENLVYAVRSDAKKRKAKAAGKVGKTNPKKTASKNHHAVGNHKAEDLLKAVASELGISHAMAVLQAEHDRVHRLLGG